MALYVSSEMKISPGFADDSKREAVFTTSPKTSFFSSRQSPVCMPMRASSSAL